MTNSNYPSTPGAYFIPHPWDAHSRAHPISAWFERYTTEFFDGRNYEPAAINKWHTSDFTFVGWDGVPHSGREKAWEAIRALFLGPFTASLHSPMASAIVPLDDVEAGGKGKTWAMLAYANAYFDLKGQVDGKEKGKKVKSPDGKEWDLVTPSAYKFYFVEGTEEGNGGIALSKTEVFCDTAPLMKILGAA